MVISVGSDRLPQSRKEVRWEASLVLFQTETKRALPGIPGQTYHGPSCWVKVHNADEHTRSKRCPAALRQLWMVQVSTEHIGGALCRDYNCLTILLYT